MPDPCCHPRVQVRSGPILSCRFRVTAEPPRGTHHTGSLESPGRSTQGEAQKGDWAGRAVNASLALVERESLVRQGVHCGLADCPQVAAVIPKDEEVIAVPDVLATAKPIHDDVVKAVKKDIGKELTGEVPDGNPVPPLDWCQEVITWKPLADGFLGIAGIDDSVQNGEHRLVGHHAPKLLLEGLMVDGWEELLHVPLEHKFPAGHERGRAQERHVASLPLAAGVGVRHKAALKVRLQDGYERVVDNAVAKGCRADESRLGLLHHKGRVGTRLPRVAGQFLGEAEALRFQVEEESTRVSLEALATRGGAGRADQVGWVTQDLEEFAMDADAFRHAPTCVPRLTCSWAQ